MFSTLSEFYKSGAWKNCMRAIKAERINEEGFNICEHCGAPIVKKYDCIGHHKNPLTMGNVNNPEISLNPDNIALLHFRCHEEVHNRFGLFIPQKVFIVHGAPLSGKNTFVKENKGNRDIVVDMDKLWEAITLEPLYIKNNYLKTNVFELRNTLIDQIRMRRGQWQTAWVIGSYPRQGERERLADRLGAELIHIDTTQEECLERFTQSSRPPEWENYIKEYFTSFS